ncbi:hypothetical protein ACPGBC_000874 [Enterobacter quasiroggenkampii]
MPNLTQLFLDSDKHYIYILHSDKHYIYILPIVGLTIPERYSFDDVSIHPANTLEFNDLFKVGPAGIGKTHAIVSAAFNIIYIMRTSV